jgi:hypothetical protein
MNQRGYAGAGLTKLRDGLDLKSSPATLHRAAAPAAQIGCAQSRKVCTQASNIGVRQPSVGCDVDGPRQHACLHART